MKVKSGFLRINKNSAVNLSGWRSAKTRAKKKNVPLHKLLKASWKHQGKIFFVESTLHGVRYIAEADRPIIERLIWFICVMIGAISTIVIIVSLWEKFQTNPTITGLDTDFHNWDIPFPAVTLCPNQPWNEGRLNAYVQKMQTDHDLDTSAVNKLTAFLKHLTQLSFATMSIDELQPEFDALFQGQDLYKVTYELMETCEDFFKECKWRSEAYNCCLGFFPIFSENGFCFTFNSLHFEKKSPNGEMLKTVDIEYIKETDIKWSLAFFVEEKDPESNYNISIFLHKANELPGINLKPQHVWDYKMDLMAFSMRETYTTDDATQLSIKQRHCIFDQEMKLEIDQIYTYSACAHQCRMNNARRLCSCIPHFYHLTRLSNEFKHCNVSELRCIAENKKTISNIENCQCELGCSNTIYEVDKLVQTAAKVPETSDEDSQDGMADFGSQFDGDEESPSSLSNDTDTDGGNRTETSTTTTTLESAKVETDPPTASAPLKSFECEFTSWPMIKYKREVLFGWVDLLVSFGGIAGLFLGFSLLSGVEIIYYFTIRACCMIYKQRDELEKMASESTENATNEKRKNNDLMLVPYFVSDQKPQKGEDLLRRRIKENANFKVQPVSPANKQSQKTMPTQPTMVKPTTRPFRMTPPNKVVASPFGFDYYN